MIKFIEIPASKQSLSQRKLMYGIGINDATYIINPYVNGLPTQRCPYYRKWADMLKRCYSPSFLITEPSYVGSYVCQEWLRFSVFKEWMKTQDWESKQLGYLILNPGNKVYSPEQCVFVTHDLNSLLTDCKAARGKYPQGVSRSLQGKYLYQVKVNKGGKCVYLGKYNNIKEASNAYILSKTEYIKEVASTQPNNIKKGLLLHANILINQLEY